MITPVLVNLNSLDLHYYPVMNSLDKCTGSCNAHAHAHDLSTKYVFQVKQKRHILKYLV